MDTSPTGERRQRRMPGGRTERIVVRVDPYTWSRLKLRAVTAGRSLPAYLVEAGLRPLIAGSSGMSLAGQRAMAEQLDTVLTRLRQSGNPLNSPTGQRRQRRMPGGRTERIVVRVDPDTWSHLKLRAVPLAGRCRRTWSRSACIR